MLEALIKTPRSTPCAVLFILSWNYRYINFFPSVWLFVLKICHSNVTALICIFRDHRLEIVLVGMRYSKSVTNLFGSR